METIKSKRDFERVFTGGRRYSHPLVRVTVLSKDIKDFEDIADISGMSATGRVAFVAAKRLGNAVYRNRCKRVLREAARTCGLPANGADVLMFATRKTHDSTPQEVSLALEHLLRKAHVL